MNAGYPIDVSWDEEDEVWIADVADLAFCTAHGPTPHDAVEEVEQAAEAWLEAASKAGRPIPEPSRRVVQGLPG